MDGPSIHRDAVRERPQALSPVEVTDLQERLREAEETLDAIRTGTVDAVVVNSSAGSQVYSLSGAEQPYRIYMERMQEGAVTAAAAGTVLYCNRRFAEMLDLPLQRVIGTNLRSFISDHAWAMLSSVLSHGTETIKLGGDLVRSSGAALPVAFTASTLLLDSREVMCLVITDLTERREQEELRRAKDVAEKANLAKDAFLAALSHELRMPLNPALIAVAGLAENASLPSDVREQLGMVRRNVELEAQLIDDLLDLTRISQGKLECRQIPFDFHVTVADAIGICQTQFEAKHHCLKVSLDAQATAMIGDPVRLQQAVWNLLRNAAKFTSPGGTISVRTHSHEGRIRLEVKDSGIGFKPEMAKTLFCAFAQGGQHITREFGGLGLGLAITRSIVAAHGGTVCGDSPGEGRGATFVIELPTQPMRAPAKSNPAPEPTVAFQPLRILLVEDYADTRLAMVGMLQRTGHAVMGVATAGEALKIAETEPFDVVVADLGLPDQSGLELMKHLRDRYGLEGVATTGYGTQEDIAKCREAGFVEHLTKPINIARLRRVLAGRRWVPKPH